MEDCHKWLFISGLAPLSMRCQRVDGRTARENHAYSGKNVSSATKGLGGR